MMLKLNPPTLNVLHKVEGKAYAATKTSTIAYHSSLLDPTYPELDYSVPTIFTSTNGIEAVYKISSLSRRW
jgi:hypothetical protein